MSDYSKENFGCGLIAGLIAIGVVTLCVHFGTISAVSAPIIDKRIVPGGYRQAAGWVIVIKGEDGLPASVYVTESEWESLSINQSVNLSASTARLIGGTTYTLNRK